MKHRKPSVKKSVSVTAAMLLLAACVVCDSKYNIKVTHYQLSFENIPQEFNGFRIVHISDLHGMEFGKDNERLIKLVAGQNPDMIAITGDMAENLPEMQVLEKLLDGIGQLAPTYYVTGNHEWGGKVVPEIRELMENHGIEYLDNEYKTIERKGELIVVAGVDDPNGWADMIRPEELAERLRTEYPENFTVFLGHRNYWVEKYPELPVDLILSGHAHGGIVRLPLVGGLFNTSHRLGAEYEKGLYYSESYVMEVSCGLGNSIPVPRLFNRPELVVIELKNGQS